MDRKTIHDILPVLVAFAHGLRIQFRDLCRDGFYEDQGWLDINPETTEFRLGDDTNPQEWRVKPGQRPIVIRSADQEVVVGILPEEGSGADPLKESEDLVQELDHRCKERHRRAKQWLDSQDPPIIDDPTAPQIDYRRLLGQYMQMVVDAEGVDFIPREARIDPSKHDPGWGELSLVEQQELQHISTELFGPYLTESPVKKSTAKMEPPYPWPDPPDEGPGLTDGPVRRDE